MITKGIITGRNISGILLGFLLWITATTSVGAHWYFGGARSMVSKIPKAFAPNNNLDDVYSSRDKGSASSRSYRALSSGSVTIDGECFICSEKAGNSANFVKTLTILYHGSYTGGEGYQSGSNICGAGTYPVDSILQIVDADGLGFSVKDLAIGDAITLSSTGDFNGKPYFDSDITFNWLSYDGTVLESCKIDVSCSYNPVVANDQVGPWTIVSGRGNLDYGSGCIEQPEDNIVTTIRNGSPFDSTSNDFAVERTSSVSGTVTDDRDGYRDDEEPLSNATDRLIDDSGANIGRVLTLAAAQAQNGFDALFGPWASATEKVFLDNEDVTFSMKWKVVSEELIIRLSSSTLGWLGFGFGELASGSMLGADVVVVSVDPSTGEISASDRYVPWTAYPLDEGRVPFPELDLQQDWAVLGGEQTENGTVVVLKRKLDTGDHQDRVVSLQDSTSILFAYGVGSVMGYHGPGRGVGSINFGNHNVTADFKPPQDADLFVDVMIPDVELPIEQSDSYVYYSVDVGDLQNIVAFDFSAIAPSPNFVHHMFVYQCEMQDVHHSNHWEQFMEPQVYGYTVQHVQLSGCNKVLFGWSVGMQPFSLPDDVGIRGVRFLMFEVHMNTLGRTNAGMTTASAGGIRLYISSKERKKAGHTLLLNYIEFDESYMPLEPIVHYEAECSSSCTSRNYESLDVFATIQHMHSHGKQVWISRYDSDNNYKGLIGRTDFYNFQFQKIHQADAVIEPGDIIRLHCVFDTSKATAPVSWGDRSQEEMCVVYLFYSTEGNEPNVRDCGGLLFPNMKDESFNYCNREPLFDGIELQTITDSSLCNAPSPGYFPLPVEFGPTSPKPKLPLRNAISKCSALGLKEPALIALQCFVWCVICAILLIAFVDCGPREDGNNEAVPSGDRTQTVLNRSESGNARESILDTEACQTSVCSKRAPTREELMQNQLVRTAKEMSTNCESNSNLTLVGRFREHVETEPGRLCLAWLDEETNIVNSFTRKQLSDKSRALAWFLLSTKGIKAGDRVMIVYPFGIEFMVGLMALLRIGAIVVSVYPPDPTKLETDIPKFDHFVQDSGAKTALTTKVYLRMVRMSGLTGKNWPDEIEWIASDARLPTAPGNFHEEKVASNCVALLQYTSGSTNKPKGVMITHRNMTHQLDYLFRCLAVFGGNDKADAFVSVAWTPQFHDMGLFGSFLSCLWTGGTSYAMSPLTFLRDPPVWVKAMRRYNATCTNSPNFAIALTCKRLKQQGLNSISRIKSLKFVVLGAEPCNIRLLDDMENVMGIERSAVSHMYGLAEHVLAATAGSSQTVFSDSLWSVGSLDFTKLMGDVSVCVVDPKHRVQVPPGQQGEIWINSPCVAAGYWGKPELSSSVFRARREDDPLHTYLRTGDLGFVRNNELFVVSRIRDLIIIHGKNIAPSDVEHAAEERFADKIRPGSSVAFQVSAESAVLLCELREQTCTALPLAEEVRSHVCRVVDGISLVDVVLLTRGSVKKTSSGKVRRAAMKTLWETGCLASCMTVSKENTKTRNMQSSTSLEELFRAVGVEDFDKTLVENGVDSIKLVTLVDIAREKFGVQIDYAQASTFRTADILLLATSANSSGIPLDLPCSLRFSEALCKERLPALSVRYLRQMVVMIVVLSTVFVSTMPFAFFVRQNATYRSTGWFQNFRCGPLLTLALPAWMLVYSGVCIVLKWLFIGRMQSGHFLGMWSGGFCRFWIVTRLVSVWEATVGILVADTVWRNIFYNSLGANISMTAHIHTQIGCWDLVSIGPRSEVKGSIYSRTIQWNGVHFNQITIASDCFIGSGAVLMAGTSLGESVIVSCRTVVPIGEDLPGNTAWSGVPCTIDANAQNTVHPTGYSAYFIMLRAVAPIITLAAVIGSWWVANEVVPPIDPSSGLDPNGALRNLAPDYFGYAVYLEHWNMSAMKLDASFLLVYQLTGLILLCGCLSLKWSFFCPYFVDFLEPLIMTWYFPYIGKTILHEWWQRAFGLRAGKGTKLCSARSVVAPSLAHRVKVGEKSIVFGCRFAPRSSPQGVARHVLGWISSCGRLRAPWVSIWSGPDITIGDECECSFGCYIESGVTMDIGSGSATLARIQEGTTVQSGQCIVGNPANFFLSTKRSSEAMHFSPNPFLASLRMILFCLHAGFLLAGFLLVLEIVRDIPLGSWNLEYRVPILIGLAYALMVSLLVVELVFVKKVLFGRTRTGSVPLDSFRGIVFHHMQVISVFLNTLASPVFAGMFPMVLFYKLLGATIDLSVFINLFGDSDPGDADGTTIMPFAVLDEGSSCVAHRVDGGHLHQGSVVLEKGATLHPWSSLVMGSMGQNSHLFPLSKSLRETHSKDGELWIGTPSVLGESSNEPRNHHRLAEEVVC